MVRSGFPYATVPHALLDQVGTPGFHARVLLYLVIHRHSSGSAMGCWCSIETMAREAGKSPRTVRRTLAQLVAEGWVERQQRPGRTTVYRLPAAPPTLATRDTPPRPFQTPRPGHQGRGTSGSDVTPAITAPGSGDTPATTDTPPRSPGTVRPGHQGRDTPAIRDTRTRTQEQEPLIQNPGTRLSSEFSPSFVSLTPADGQSQGEGPGRQQPARPRPSAKAARPALPPELEPFGRRIEAYWSVKGGSRTGAAFDALAEELLVVARRAGPSAVEQLLRQATQAGWPTVNADAWLSHHREELAMARHPAYQEFRAGRS